MSDDGQWTIKTRWSTVYRLWSFYKTKISTTLPCPISMNEKMWQGLFFDTLKSDVVSP